VASSPVWNRDIWQRLTQAYLSTKHGNSWLDHHGERLLQP